MYTITPESHLEATAAQETQPASATPTVPLGTPPTEEPAPTTPTQEPPAIATPGAVDTWAPHYSGYDALPPAPPFGGLPPSAQPRGPRRRRWMPALVALVLLVVLGTGVGVGAAVAGSRPSGNTITIGATSAPAVTVSSSTTSLQQSVESVAKAVEPSVVKITSTNGSQEGVGSGDIITSNGYIVTNDHVVNGFTNFTVTLSNGRSYTATVVGQDPQDDLAVIKINATGLTPIAFADSSKVTVGEFAVAVGNPLALQESATFGTVSALNGTASEAPNGPASVLTGLIQTTAPITNGNSGGALVNLQGQLIGIPTLEETNNETGSASGFGYAIPANRVQTIAQQLIQHGSVTSTGQGFLGIEAQDVTPQVAAADGLSVQSGVLVMAFANDAAGQSPAQQAGLQTGDVITAVNGQAVSSSNDLSSALLSQKPGTKVTLTVVRGSSTQTISVTLGERPTNTQG